MKHPSQLLSVVGSGEVRCESRYITQVGLLTGLTSSFFSTDDGASEGVILRIRVRLLGEHGHSVVLLGVIFTTSRCNLLLTLYVGLTVEREA